MKSDTIAVHGGYETEPTTRAVAVPIYQTVAYEFESADHGAALFNLEVEGHRYSRISNPTTAVLERRIAELEGGVEALCTSTGQAALNYAILNLADMGTNIVSVPQLYGTTHTLFAHLLPSQGITVRFAESDTADAIEKLIDDNTRAIFCESIGNPAGNICDIEKLAAVAKRHGIRIDRPIDLVKRHFTETQLPAGPDAHNLNQDGSWPYSGPDKGGNPWPAMTCSGLSRPAATIRRAISNSSSPDSSP